MTGGDLQMSTSSVHDKSDYSINNHFIWSSIKKFIYLAYTFSSTSQNFDVFSKVLYDRVRFLDFIFLEITMGISYMFMDVFIKQYTRKIDCYQYLNPLLRGINLGCILQSLMWNIILAGDLADSVRFFFAGLHELPPWSTCERLPRQTTCVPTISIMLRCHNNVKTYLNVTSVNVNYQKQSDVPDVHLIVINGPDVVDISCRSHRSLLTVTFRLSYFTSDRSDITARLFVLTLVWIINFFLATFTDSALFKLIRIASLWRMCSTVFVLIFTLIYTEYFFTTAISQMFDITAPRVYTSSIDRITFAFGIGLVGVYDFGTMSSLTMVDNAVVLFGIFFTTFAFARSVIVRVLYLALTTCIKTDVAINSHYLLFVILPLSSEFLHAQKVFTIYIYVNVMCSLVAYLALLTLTISKFLHNEFRSVKNVYMVGILCFLCCNLSYPIALLSKNKLMGIMQGLNFTVLYLGGFKVAVVMWIYGVGKFSTDIQFSLGFKPTQFWTTCWMMHPILTLIFIIQKIYILTNLTEKVQMILASTWILFSFCFVTIFQIKTIAKYMVHNNLAGVLKPSSKYGPPEPEDRLRRQAFNVALWHRQCFHRCIVIDEKTDCNHLPLMFREKSKLRSLSDTSLTNIFEAGPSTKKGSVVMDSAQMHLN